MKIAIAGAGAMGCRFGYMLTKTGQEVTLIDEWPAHIEAIQKNGLKVVDGDNTDTIDIKIIRPEEATEEVDVVITNFVYEKEQARRKKIMRYQSSFPENTVFTWQDAKPLRKGKYMMMHSLMYRLDILKQSKLQLPEHTFYVDNLFVFIPLQYCKKLYYINVDFYRYFIGREDQSVNEQVMIRRIDQQIRVNQLLMEAYHSDWEFPKVLNDYLLNHLEITTLISCALLNKAGTQEHQEKKKALLEKLKETNTPVYKEIRKNVISKIAMNDNAPARQMSNLIYTVTQKIVGFN